jgi:transmembrane sensor
MGGITVNHEQNKMVTMPTAAEDRLSPYSEALRAHFPAKEAILREAKQQTQQRRRFKKVIISTGICVLLALAWLDPVISTETLQTAIGQQATVQLKDGSQVVLNTNSVLVAEQHLRSRQLYLQQGEALFTVQHGWQPFTVYANQAEIRDIGTAFNVRHTQHGVMVTVVEGRVEVHTAQDTRLLTQGMSVNTQAGAIAEHCCTSEHAAIAWQQGRLMFDASTLAEVVAELQRYHVGHIEIADQRIAQYRLSGEYDIKGIDALLDTLPEVVPVRIDRRADQSVVIRHR